MSETLTPETAPKLGGSRAWVIWSLAAVAFGYAFFHRVAPSVMVSDLMSEFAISGATLGILSALYFYPYVLLQVPLGALLDVISTRKILAFALFVAAMGSILFGAATNIETAYIGRILIGIGSSVGFLSALTLAGQWFPVRKFALLSGLTMFIAMMSGIFAQAPLAIFIEHFGWRASMWSLGLFGATLAIVIFATVRNPSKAANTSTSQADVWKNMQRGLARAVRSKEVWKIALVAATMSGPMLTLGGLWGTPYLMSTYGLVRSEAAFLTSFILFGWAFSAPASGWLSDRMGNRKTLLVGGSGLLSVALGLIVFLPDSPLWLTTTLFATVGAAGATMITSFALVREVSPPEIGGSVVGIVNSMTVASGALLQPLVGALLDAQWSGSILEGARTYSASDFRWSFSIIFLSALIGFLVCLTLRTKPNLAN